MSKKMVKIIISGLFVLTFSVTVYSQEKKQAKEIDPSELQKDFDTQAEFPGGMNLFYKFVYNSIKMPKEASENKVSGTLFVRFYIEADGSLSDIKIIKDLGYGLGEEVTRVLNRSVKWKPATLDGAPVRAMYALPLKISTIY